jgi:hypothetical protein
MVVTYALGGGVSAPPVTLTSKPLTFEARLPPGADDIRQFVSASTLTLTQQFSRALTGLKVGGAVTRTISMTATDSWSAMLPAVETAPIDGVSIYPKAPVLRDINADRGARRAERIESTSYVFERPGSFTLPAVSVAWWDGRAQRMRTIALPATPITVVAAAASSASEIAFRDEEGEARAAEALVRAERQKRDRLAILVASGVLAFVVIVWMVRRVGPRIAGAVADGWHEAIESEPVYFFRAWRASGSGHASRTYGATLAWIDRIWTMPGEPATIEQVAIATADPALAHEVTALEAQLFGRPDPARDAWSGRRFSELLWKARRILLEKSRVHAHAGVAPLPPLNPTDHHGRVHTQPS